MRPRDRQRRRRRHHRLAFRPGAEGLEPRIALNAQVGVNLNYNEPYENDPIWTDLHNTATGWSPSSVSLTADGYPLANATTEFEVTDYPTGDYQFSYTGSGTVTFSGDGQLVGSVTVANGLTTGTVAVTGTTSQGAYVYMQATNINPSDPMDNFHLMLPGYGNGTTPEPMFTPAFIQALKPFSDIRFMNWEQINFSTLSNWQDRVQPDSFVTTGNGGVPYEDMIELCNEAQKDMWINIPAEATPQFVQSMAQLIATDLDPNLNVYVEYGNEDWNTGFSAYGQIAAAAARNPILNQSLGQYQLVAQQTAYSLVTDGQIFETAFGSGASRVRPILGGQFSWTAFQSDELQFIQQQFGAPSQYIYATAVAPYLGYGGGDTNLTVSYIISWFSQELEDVTVPAMQANAALDKQYNVPMVGYESGPAIVPNASDMNVLLQAQNDPRMDLLYQQYIEDWEQAGGGLINQYTFDAIPSSGGLWGMLDNVTQAGSPEYDGAIATMYTAGDANLDGSVNWADFQTVQANYDQPEMAYWRQGDFNDDGTVNWADLDILRQNLNPAGFTLAQFAQQAVFGDASTVDAPTAMEYDGYGATYASSLALSATSGTVDLNEDSLGNPIVLGGAAYSQGLGFTADSTTTIALGGQYSRFDSTIGVDDDGSTASSVIFEVYGDDNLLYQSPVESYGSAVPIDLNVAGVQKLTLVVEAAPGSSAADDHGVWADARLISTSNFGATTPYSLTWQVSQNGQVISTQTADSFSFAALSGTYTVTLTVTNAQGDQATASTNVTVVPDVPTAALSQEDIVTLGNWMGAYGSLGYDILGEGTSLPDYATASVAGASTLTWTDNTTDPRGLDEPDGVGAVAMAWSGSSFTINVNLGDGQVHGLALYAVDWDSQSRVEEFQVINPLTGAVLDTETISSFSGGEYVQWAVSGDVEIKVTSLSGPNAVVSGLFLDTVAAPWSPTSATFVKTDTTTSGNWIGTYGSQGVDIEGFAPTLSSYANVVVTGALTYGYPSSDTTQLEDPIGSGRTSTEWSSNTSFTVRVDPTDGKVHDLTVYAVDGADEGRVEQLQLISVATGAVLDTETISSFANGVYVQWAISGDVELKVIDVSGGNPVISGIFLDPGNTPSTPPVSASLVKTDTTAQGNWIGTYGSQGEDIEGFAPSLPSYATVSVTGASTYAWATRTTDPRALEDPVGSGRSATTWLSATSFTINVDLTDGQVHDVALYAVDFGDSGLSEQFQVTNAVTGSMLDTVTLASFSGGEYVQWALSGDVNIVVTRLAGGNAIVSGLFFGGPFTPPVSASLVKTDTTAQGNWIGTYGSQGEDIEGFAPSLPSYATVSVTGASTYAWAMSTTDPRALEDPVGSGRSATTWFSDNSFTINVDLTDGQVHDVALYAVDFGDSGRSERIQVTNAVTGAVLDTETISSFAGGEYVQWALSGDVNIVVTCLAGGNAVVSGLFFDAPTTAAAPSASLVKTDTTAQGNWIGTYGSQGEDIEGFAPSLPSYATVSVTGASTYTWAASTTDPRALEDPVGSGRSATTWFGATSFTINVDLTDGQVHDMALYAVDFGDGGRSERIQVTNAVTGAVLDTETISSFSGGEYVQWALSGDVNIVVTRLAGGNAVVSGLFFDAPTTAAAPSASLVKTDTTTQGNWIGTYGTQGEDIEGFAPSLPSYATVSVTGASTYTWAASTTDPRALEDPVGSGRSATTWFGATSFTINVDLTDGQVHDVALYAVDFGDGGRSERIQVTNAVTGAVLDTETISSFSGGEYVQWALSGDVNIVVTRLAGGNAVVSGLFFDAPPAGAATVATAGLVATNTATQGSETGALGTSGDDPAGSMASWPSAAAAAVTVASTDALATGTTNPAAVASGTLSSAISVGLTDEEQHDLALLAIDQDDPGRDRQI